MQRSPDTSVGGAAKKQKHKTKNKRRANPRKNARAAAHPHQISEKPARAFRRFFANHPNPRKKKKKKKATIESFGDIGKGSTGTLKNGNEAEKKRKKRGKFIALAQDSFKRAPKLKPPWLGSYALRKKKNVY